MAKTANRKPPNSAGRCTKSDPPAGAKRGKTKAAAIAVPNPLVAGEAWSDQALADCKAMKAGAQQAWAAYLDHCKGAGAGSPAAKWSAQADQLVDAIGRAAFKEHVLRWFPLVDKPRTKPAPRGGYYRGDPTLLISDLHQDILKGMVWCCAKTEDRDLARALGALALSAYKKVPGIGPRAVKLGNACVYALGAMPGLDAVGHLAFLKVKVKFGTAQIGIEKALNAAAARAGLPREDLEEMGVPAYGLGEVGVREEKLGDVTVRLTVTGTSEIEWSWTDKGGKALKAPPAALKKDFAEDLKELKNAAKDLQKMLPAQRERIDGLFLQQKTWPFDAWRERYLEHPLIGTLARRIVWTFRSGKSASDGIWVDGQLAGLDGKPLKGLDAKTTVELWHPIGRKVEEVVAWRAFLEKHGIRQPFKQAHREVYVLTDAERQTATYSNRFAAHIIKQHQFNALCGLRGWKNKLRLMVDDSFPPTQIALPKWGLRAEFWVEGAGSEYGRDTNEVGTFLYLSTDQVRFYPIEAGQHAAHGYGGGYEPPRVDRAVQARERSPNDPLPLAEIPPLVFSEVMRDVDLFVGVASVGNDPRWADGGRNGGYREYWRNFSFGDLSATAQTRKKILEGLLPKLKIASRCSFTERFLVVKGDVRAYHIHLGSGNILMEPNDQYLCIVPSQGVKGAADGLYLPFEGDNTLAVILSKAFLLADDTKIKDPSIVSQLKEK